MQGTLCPVGIVFKRVSDSCDEPVPFFGRAVIVQHHLECRNAGMAASVVRPSIIWHMSSNTAFISCSCSGCILASVKTLPAAAPRGRLWVGSRCPLFPALFVGIYAEP